MSKKVHPKWLKHFYISGFGYVGCAVPSCNWITYGGDEGLRSLYALVRDHWREKHAK